MISYPANSACSRRFEVGDGDSHRTICREVRRNFCRARSWPFVPAEEVVRCKSQAEGKFQIDLQLGTCFDAHKRNGDVSGFREPIDVEAFELDEAGASKSRLRNRCITRQCSGPSRRVSFL